MLFRSEKLATLRDKELLKEMGISINAVGQASRQTIEGIKTNFVERLVRARSVDFVTEAGAGGLVQMFESSPEFDVDLISAEVLRERRPDLVKIIEAEVKARMQQEVKHKMELEDQIKEKDEQIESLTNERNELKTKLTESEKAKAIAETKARVDEAVSKSELPEPAKVRLLEKFKDAEKDEGLEDAIKSERDYVASLLEAGKVKGMGGSLAAPDKESLKEAFKHLHPEWGERELEVAVNGK